MERVDLDTLGLSVLAFSASFNLHTNKAGLWWMLTVLNDINRAYSGLVAVGGVIGWIKAGSAASLVAVSVQALPNDTKLVISHVY